MLSRLDRRTLCVVLALCAITLGLADVSAQQRRRRSRRVTHPVRTTQTTLPVPTPIPSPPPDATIISTAEDEANNDISTNDGGDQTTSTRRSNRTRANSAETEQETLRRSVNRMSRDITRLNDKMSKMEEDQRAIVYMDLLSRAEQRAETFRRQLEDVSEKEAALQARALQIENDIKPESIERAVGLIGTTRPEEMREQRRQQLENERTSVQTRLQQIAASRARLEAALITTDQEIERLRARLNDYINPGDATTTTTNTSTNNEGITTTPTPTPSPSPSPYPR